MALHFENLKLESELKKEQFNTLSKVDGESLDDELKDLAIEAKGNYLLPSWPERVRHHYKGNHVKNSRFGGLDIYRAAYFRAMDRHHKELQLAELEKENQLQDFKDGLEYEQMVIQREKQERKAQIKEYS